MNKPPNKGELSYTLIIKKEYAIPLHKKVILDKAIEVFIDEIPEWQKKETLRRIEQINLDSYTMLSSEEFWDSIDADDK